MDHVLQINVLPIKLLPYAICRRFVLIKAMMLTLVLSIISFCTLFDFSRSFKSWATEMAEKQILFDVRASAINNEIARGQLKKLDEIKDAVFVATYYLGVGEVSNVRAYIISEISDEGKLHEMYGSQVSFANLDKNEILLTDKLLKDLNVKNCSFIGICRY